MFTRELTFIVIAFILVVPATIFSSSTFYVYAVPPDPNYGGIDCRFDSPDSSAVTCCWLEDVEPGTGNPNTEGADQEVYCQTCRTSQDCDPKELQYGPPLPTGDLPQLETVPPNRTLPGGGVGDLPTLEQVPPRGLPGGGNLPTLQPGPGLNQGTEGEPPLPVVCSEEAGLEKDPETGQCVPIEPEVPEQPEEQEEQSTQDGGEEQSEDGGDDSSEDGGNSNEGDN